ncbi:MAG: hypothetical protein WAK71_22580, partial [Streptosporangiaceae bacterium]
MAAPGAGWGSIPATWKGQPMPGYNSRRAAGQRDAGLRRVGRITWRAAAAGLAGAAVAALAFAQHATAGASTPG